MASTALPTVKIFRDRAPDATIGNIILVYRGTFNVPLLASGPIPEDQQALATALHLAEANHPEYQGYLISQLRHPVNHP